jgi:hypothetical protein
MTICSFFFLSDWQAAHVSEVCNIRDPLSFPVILHTHDRQQFANNKTLFQIGKQRASVRSATYVARFPAKGVLFKQSVTDTTVGATDKVGSAP